VLEPQERHLGHVIRDSIASTFGESVSSSPHFGELRTLLVSSMRGISMTYASAPRDPYTEPHLEIMRGTGKSRDRPSEARFVVGTRQNSRTRSAAVPEGSLMLNENLSARVSQQLSLYLAKQNDPVGVGNSGCRREI